MLIVLSGVRAGGAGAGGAGAGVEWMQAHQQKFCFAKNLDKSKKIWAMKLRHFLAILPKQHFFVIECINKSSLYHRKHI